VTVHDKGAGGTLFSNVVYWKAEAPVTACGKFVHPECSQNFM